MSLALPDTEKDVPKSVPLPNEHVESLQQTPTHATYYEPLDINELTEAHRKYLLERHGTLSLDPLPDYGDADPYNWSSTKVRILVMCTLLRAKFQHSESGQSAAGCLSCDDGDFHSSFDSIRVREYCRRSPREPSTNNIPHITFHRYPWRCSIVLATHFKTLRPTTGLPCITHLRRSWKHWMCRESLVCIDGSLPSDHSFLYQPTCRYR